MRGLSFALLSLCLAGAAAGCSGGTSNIPGESSSGGTSGTSGGTSGTIETPPETPPSASWNGKVSGCDEIFAFRGSTDGTQFVTVQVDRETVGLKYGETRTFDLSRPQAGIKVAIEIFPRVPKDQRYCNDGVTDWVTTTVWPAEAGSLVVELGERKDRPSGPSTYKATVRIEGLRVVGPDRGTSVVIPKIEMKDVTVGWRAG